MNFNCFVLFSLLLVNFTCGQDDGDATKIFLRLYNGISLDEYVDEPVEEARGLVKFMLPREKPTIIYIHGFSEDVGRESVNTTVRAFLNRRTHNVIAADWSVISKQNYVKVSLSARTVGETLARGIEQMVKAGLPWQKLHLVGHSMGAQICGYIGRSLKFDVPRITALDPAGPLFQLVLDNLTNRDATFVDIIHTDMGFYGNAKETGTVDFYPNDGTRVQPGCPKIFKPYSDPSFCSHHRSWRFFAESVNNPIALMAVKCDSYKSFTSGKCEGNEVIPMGMATPRKANGTYYLTTSTESPYGTGLTGAKAPAAGCSGCFLKDFIKRLF